MREIINFIGDGKHYSISDNRQFRHAVESML